MTFRLHASSASTVPVPHAVVADGRALRPVDNAPADRDDPRKRRAKRWPTARGMRPGVSPDTSRCASRTCPDPRAHLSYESSDLAAPQDNPTTASPEASPWLPARRPTSGSSSAPAPGRSSSTASAKGPSRSISGRAPAPAGGGGRRLRTGPNRGGRLDYFRRDDRSSCAPRLACAHQLRDRDARYERCGKTMAVANAARWRAPWSARSVASVDR